MKGILIGLLKNAVSQVMSLSNFTPSNNAFVRSAQAKAINSIRRY